MRTNTLVVLIAVAMLGGSSIAMAKGGGGGSGGSGMSHGSGHGHFGHHFQRFLRNQVFFGDGWGWAWGPYSGDGAKYNRFSPANCAPLSRGRPNWLNSRYAVSLECGNIHRALLEGRNGAGPGRELPLNLSA